MCCCVWQYDEAERWYLAIFSVLPNDKETKLMLGEGRSSSYFFFTFSSLFPFFFMRIFLLFHPLFDFAAGNLYLLKEDMMKAQTCFEEINASSNKEALTHSLFAVSC